MTNDVGRFSPSQRAELGNFSDEHLLVGAYALHALDDKESLSFQAHLASCSNCREELVGLQAAAAEVGAAHSAAAPAGMRASVLGALSLTPQISAAGAPSTVAPISAVAASEKITEPNTNLVDLDSRRGPNRSTRILTVAAAILAVVAGGLGWRTATLSGQLDQAQVVAAQVSGVLTAPDARTTAGVVTTGGRASVVASTSLARSVVVTDGVAAAPSGSVYQVWLLAPSGGATSAGFLPATADGTSATVLAGSIDQAAAVGISLEPAGGSSAPTTTPVFVVPV